MSQAAFSKRAREQYDRLLGYHPAEGFKMTNARTVWVADESQGFVRCEVIKVNGDKIDLKMPDGALKTLPEKQTLPANPGKFDGVPDCAELSHLNNATVFQNLKVRYLEDLIHTSSGLFLVVINPYKWLQIYTPEMIEMYRGKRRAEVHPHTYAIADEAYRAMVRNAHSQSMLITGESGAGKTENTKKVIQYLATIAGKAAGSGKLEEQILQANPMLEAFGNAKTNKNDNSSRFGKYIRIEFVNGTIVGTTIQSYLLEKSRVTYQGRGERTFHIFYQLLKGASPQQKAKYHLRDIGWYKLFCDPDSNRCKSMEDDKEFEHTVNAMTVIGMSPSEQDAVFRMVSGVLLAANLKFEASFGSTGAKIANGELITQIAELWDVDATALEKSLIRPKVKAGTEIVEKHLSPEEASYARNAMCKSVYERSFLWLVKKLNVVLSASFSENFIGVLDIAGFEIFEKNSFEQLCINFTNEKLQQFFNDHMFKLEQEEYAKEQIDWKYVDFGVDSAQTIALLEAKDASVMALLDEQTIFPRATDKTLITALHTLEKKSPKYATVQFQELRFKITHYAGDVTYDVTEWVTKNKDPLQDDIGKCIAASKTKFFADLLNDVDLDPRAKMAARKKERLLAAGKSASSMSEQGGATFMTVAQVYQDQLNDLMATLRSTEPSFIRCIIPNLQKKSHLLQADLVLEQLACNGVLEGIRISRMGYPNRVAYQPFLKRYYLLHPTLRRDDPNYRESSETLMVHLTASIKEHLKESDIPTPYFQYGLTKVFFRHGVLAYLEELREAKISQMVLSIQSAARGWLGRRALKNVNSQGSAAKTLQKNMRVWLKFRQWLWWKLFVQSKPLLQKVGMDTMIKEQEEAIEAAQKALKAAEEEIARLGKDYGGKKDKLMDLKIELDEARGRLERLEQQRAALQGENEKLDGDIKSLENQVRDAEKANAEKTADIKAYRQDLDDAQKRLAGENDQISSLEKSRDANAAEIKKLGSDASEVDAAGAKLRKQLADVEAALNKARSTLNAGEDSGSRLKKALDKLEADKEQQKDELDAEKAAAEKLTAASKKLKGQIDETTGDVNQTRAQVTATQQAGKTLQADINDTQGRLDSAGKANAEKKKKASQLTADAASAKKEADSEAEATAARDKKNKEEQQRVNDLRAAIESVQGDIARLENDKRANAVAQDGARHKHQDHEAELQKLRKRLAQLQEDLKAAQAQLDEARKAKAEADKAVKKADGALKDVRSELDGAKAAADRAAKDAEKFKKQLNDVRAEQDDAEAAADAQAARNGQQRAELDERREALDAAEEKAEALSRAAKALQLEVDDVKRQREEAAEERERAAKQGAAALVKEKQDALNALEAQQRDLENELKAKEAAAQAAQASAGAAEAEQEKSKWASFLDRLQHELDNTRANIRSLEERNKIAEKTLGATRMAALAAGTSGQEEKAKETGDLYGYAQPEKPKVKSEHPAWVIVQQRTFTRWCNSFLVERMVRINDLEDDFCDGIKLCQLMEIISNQKVGNYKKDPKIRVHKLENVKLALSFVQAQGIRLVGIGPEDIVDGKLKLVLGLIWTIILRYQISEGDGSGSPKKALLDWINKKIGTGTKYNLNVTNFLADWKDGRAICALVDAIEPGTSLRWPADVSGNALRDCTMAFDAATKKGIPELLEPADMADAVDELSNMTYLSFFRSWEAGNAARKQIEALRKELEVLNKAWEEYSLLLRDLAHVQREIFAHKDTTELATMVIGEKGMRN